MRLEGDDAALLTVTAPGSEQPLTTVDPPPGGCIPLAIGRATATAPAQKIDALLIAQSATAISRLAIAVSAPPAAKKPPSPPAEKVTLDATTDCPWPWCGADLDSDSSIPIALGTEAATVSSPTEGETIGVLVNGSDQAELVAGKTAIENGVVTLLVSAEGLNEIGTYSGSAQLAGGDKPVTMKVDANVSDHDLLKYGAIAVGLLLGAFVVLVGNRWHPRRRLRDKAKQIYDDFAPAVTELNTAVDRPVGDQFRVDEPAVRAARDEALAAISRDEESSFLVDTTSATYKTAVDLVDRAERDRNVLRKELAGKFTALEQALDALAGQFPAVQDEPTRLTRPAFLDELRKLPRGRALAAGAATKIAASCYAGIKLIADWTPRADRWNVLSALAARFPSDPAAEPARLSLETARRLLVGASAGTALDATAIEKELGVAWAILSPLRPPREVVEDEQVTGTLSVDGAPESAARVFPLPGFSGLTSYLARPLGALATGGATVALAVSALASYYLGIEKTLADDTFGTFSDWVAALGLSGIASGASIKSATNAINLVPRTPRATGAEVKATDTEAT